MYLNFNYPEHQRPVEMGVDKDSIYFIEDLPVSSYKPPRNTSFFGILKKINLFVGANNSGKSRFLRAILKSNLYNLEYYDNPKLIESYSKEMESWHNINSRSLRNFDFQLGSELNNIYNALNFKTDTYSKILNSYSSAKPHFDKAYELMQKLIKRLDKRDLKENIRLLNKSIEFLEMVDNMKKAIIYSKNNIPDDKLYIPIFRSIKKTDSLNKDSFEIATRQLYDIKEERIFTGLDLFDRILNIRNSVKEKRKGFEEFEAFLSKHFFEGKLVEIISDYEQNHITIYVDGEERKVQDIGDGIQAIILLLFPIYTSKESTWIFIEEPETYLHPGLQRIFLETLYYDEYLVTKNLKYFFTTHSNHFLDLTLDSDEISIFQFFKESKERYLIKPNIKPSKEVLDTLGVNTSSVFLVNTSLWVEGPTDRKYISFFLRKYCDYIKKPYLKEDIDFAFFEYGGNLISHYLFEDEEFDENEEDVRDKIRAFSLSNKIYLLADEDNTDKRTKKGKRRLELERLSQIGLNFKYQNTELREIENLLPQTIIKSFARKLVDDKKHQNLENIDFSKNRYDEIGIGLFYKNEFGKADIPAKNQRQFKGEGETLKNDYKIKLCNFTIESGLKYEDLIENNPTLKRIIGELYNYILK